MVDFSEEQIMKVSKESKISDVIAMDEATAEVFFSVGMHCLGCPMSRGENVEQAANAHGVEVDELVRRLNEVIEK